MPIYVSNKVGIAIDEVAKMICQEDIIKQRELIQTLIDTVNRTNGASADDWFMFYGKTEPKRCVVCGKNIPYSRSRGIPRKYCSDSCGDKYNNQKKKAQKQTPVG